MEIKGKSRSVWIADRIRDLIEQGSGIGAATDTAIHEWNDMELYSAAESGL
jgi:hypothetical protein